jgi:GNAT superfamily N-acetyltransferase
VARITRGSVADIRRLEPLWLYVHEHHSQSMPELAPYVSPEVTWRERSSLYKELFSKEDTFLLLAWNAGDLVGYALVHVAPTGSTWVADTWETADRLAELKTLAVLPEHRGRGIGEALLTRCRQELEAGGVHDMVVGVLAGNWRASLLRTARIPPHLALPEPVSGAGAERARPGVTVGRGS